MKSRQTKYDVSYDVARERGKLAGIVRQNRPADDPELIAALQELATALAIDHLRKAFKKAPELKPEQYDRIRAAIPQGKS